jgi:hypothetical protein
MKIKTLTVIAETDNGKFHQVLLPEGVEDSIFKILADFGTINLLPTELELEMVNRKKPQPHDPL